MFRILTKIFATLFSREERRQAFGLALGILVMGFVEMLGVASIMPFLTIVTNPAIVHSNGYLSWLYTSFSFQSTQDFLFWFGLMVLIILVLNNLISAGTMGLQLRFINMRGHVISQRLLTKYLNQPYAFFLTRNSGDLVKNTIDEVNRFVAGVALPLLGLLVKGVVIVFILVLLIIVDPVLALTVMGVLGGGYWLLFASIRRRLSRIGAETFEAGVARFKIASEAFGGIKDVKILGKEADQIRRFSGPSRLYAKHETTSQALATLPRYALESLAFGGILLIVLVQLRAGRDASTIIPLVSLYAFAGYRLMPAVQQFFGSVAAIRYHASTIELLYRDLPSSGVSVPPPGVDVPAFVATSIVELDDITFGYPGAERPLFHRLNLSIRAKSTVGLVGSTGSGKTTLVDILLGLLTPQGGRLLVDGREVVPQNVRSWQMSVGYVSQNLFLADDTIIRNIAFGESDDEIDQAAVERAARLANLNDFVVRELAAGYQTVVGDRGIRLSGGQRQRIGIARALYRNPDLIILDEATSAVDGATEADIMDSIQALSGRTLVIIAHRLSTVRSCDIIYVLDRGAIVGHGTYAELMADNLHFRRMANVKSD